MQIGDKVKFTPSVFEGCKDSIKNGPGGNPLPTRAVGEIVQIHVKHRWYRVRYQLTAGTPVRHECFKF